MTESPRISVVIPMHNEEGNALPLCAEVRAVLGRLGDPFEIICVNDGSRDETLARLAELRRVDPRLRVLDLDGNFGEAAALSAGFHAARGEIVVTLDGDGQNDPADIPALLERLRADDVQAVSGRRLDRQEGLWLRVLPSRLANWLIVRVTGIPVHDCGCGLKAYRRALVRDVQLPQGLHRFLPAILGVAPGQVAEVPTRDRRRQHGQSHYGIKRTLAVLNDLMAVRFIMRDPRATEIRFGIATAGVAGIGALALRWSSLATAVFDVAALLCASVWINARRFNRAQDQGVYILHEELP